MSAICFAQMVGQPSDVDRCDVDWRNAWGYRIVLRHTHSDRDRWGAMSAVDRVKTTCLELHFSNYIAVIQQL